MATVVTLHGHQQVHSPIMHWLSCSSSGFDLYTYHNNLVFIFYPLTLSPDLSQTSVRKVIRWAFRLSASNYTCAHIPGLENVWADLISRLHRTPIVRRLLKIPPLSSMCEDGFDWPSVNNISKSQQSANRPPNMQF